MPRDIERARVIVQAFLDVLAFERGYDTFHAPLRDDLFSSPSAEEVHRLVRNLSGTLDLPRRVRQPRKSRYSRLSGGSDAVGGERV